MYREKRLSALQEFKGSSLCYINFHHIPYLTFRSVSKHKMDQE